MLRRRGGDDQLVMSVGQSLQLPISSSSSAHGIDCCFCDRKGQCSKVNRNVSLVWSS